ncbi:hypothetical protein [Streptomyces sp. MJM8645]|uniref:hypothetical protein n=1 Tax=Streptomycetaceae TaxID=2062 RepID=UPI0007AF7B02|nr:hypothetical protein [Streptomyces sp. MJM8645]
MTRRKPRHGPAAPHGSGRGRRRLLTSDTEQKLIEATRQGMPVETAAAVAGVHKASFLRWLARGREEADRRRQGEPPQPGEHDYLALLERIEQARELAHAGAVVQLRRLINGGFVIKETTRKARDPETGQIIEETVTDRAAPDFKAISFYLERQHRAHWGKDQAPEETITTAPADAVDADQLADRLAVTLHALEYPPEPSPDSPRH